jgi:hypothetical protein
MWRRYSKCRRGGAASRIATAGAAALVLMAWLGVPSNMRPASAAPSTVPAGTERLTIVQPASTVTYRVGETFLTGNRFNMAVGTTHAVEGDVYVDRAHPSNSRIGILLRRGVRARLGTHATVGRAGTARGCLFS